MPAILGAFSHQGIDRLHQRRKPSGHLSVLSSLVAAVDVGHLSGRGFVAQCVPVPTGLLSEPTRDNRARQHGQGCHNFTAGGNVVVRLSCLVVGQENHSKMVLELCDVLEKVCAFHLGGGLVALAQAELLFCRVVEAAQQESVQLSGTLLASLPLRDHRGVDAEFLVIVFPRKSKERVRNLLLRESEAVSVGLQEQVWSGCSPVTADVVALRLIHASDSKA